LWIWNYHMLLIHRSDRGMIGNFQNHKAEFNKLFEMVSEDREQQIFIDIDNLEIPPSESPLSKEVRIKEYNKLQNLLGSERLNQYKDLMKPLGIKEIRTYRNKDGSLHQATFTISKAEWKGWLNGNNYSSSKAYFRTNDPKYFEKNPEKQLTGLLDSVRLPEPAGADGHDSKFVEFMRPLPDEDGWYLYLSISGCHECMSGD
jgi:hypothetical protein